MKRSLHTPAHSSRHKRAAAGAGLADVHSSIVDCGRCPRLRDYCARVAREKKRAYLYDPYWGRPVPGFGDPEARLLLVGLAPAAHGANRTGRVFTGDGPGGSGDFLMAALHDRGFANQPYSRAADDGLMLRDAYVLCAVRCAPPGNTPTPEEIGRCLDHLDAEVKQLPRVRVVVALGRIAFDAWLRLMQRRGVRQSPKPAFGHGHMVDPGDGQPVVIGCYHPSRQNTNTGRLTGGMMRAVVAHAQRLLE